MNRLLAVAAIAALACTAIIGCSSHPTAGGGSSLGNGTIMASAVLPDGMPAANLTVRLRRSDFLTSTVSSAQLPDSTRYADTFTDAYGKFTFTGIDTGSYIIEVQKDSMLSTSSACTLFGYKDTANVGRVMLDTMANIKGKVADSTGSYIVRPFGLERIAASLGDGTFSMRLPKGTFSLQLLNQQNSKATILKDIRIDYKSNPAPEVIFALPQWGYMQRLRLNTTLSGASVNETSINFPLLVRLDRSNFDFSQTGPTGTDLRFIDKKNAFLTHEIEYWDPDAKNAAIWVHVDTILGNCDTQHVTMVWGNSAAESAIGKVFSTARGYIASWHLSDPVSSPPAIPLTITDNSDAGMVTAGYGDFVSVDGIAGKALRFAGVNDYVRVAHDSLLQLDSTVGMGITVWFKLDKIPEDTLIVLFDKTDSQNSGWQIALEKHGSNRFISFRVNSAEHAYEPFTADLQWHFLAVFRMAGGKKIKIYIDGTSTIFDHRTSGTVENTSPLLIGGKPGHSSFPGSFDEIRIWSERLLSDGLDAERSFMRLLFENQRQGQHFITFNQ